MSPEQREHIEALLAEQGVRAVTAMATEQRIPLLIKRQAGEAAIPDDGSPAPVDDLELERARVRREIREYFTPSEVAAMLRYVQLDDCVPGEFVFAEDEES